MIARFEDAFIVENLIEPPLTARTPSALLAH